MVVCDVGVVEQTETLDTEDVAKIAGLPPPPACDAMLLPPERQLQPGSASARGVPVRCELREAEEFG